jgi:6,7-dimethyl-8-ribityllumazine synthase
MLDSANPFERRGFRPESRIDMQQLAGHLDARGLSFGIVLSRFNSRITDVLLAGAIDGLTRHGAEDARISVLRVPGSFEIPQGLRLLAERKPDALIALGALVRGETPHFDHLAAVVTRALEKIAADSGLPVANGVLTCDTLEQAMERAGGKSGNKGFEAAMTAVEMANLRRLLAER